jgi:hypothetical protein
MDGEPIDEVGCSYSKPLRAARDGTQVVYGPIEQEYSLAAKRCRGYRRARLNNDGVAGFDTRSPAVGGICIRRYATAGNGGVVDRCRLVASSESAINHSKRRGQKRRRSCNPAQKIPRTDALHPPTPKFNSLRLMRPFFLQRVAHCPAPDAGKTPRD